MNKEFNTIVDNICEKDFRYKPDAYNFVMEALSFTQKKFKKDKHVSGVELLKGVRDLMLDEYGPMSLTILRHWGINTTEDFGNIVFNLVKNKVLSKTADDRIEQFRDGYDFEEVFQKGYTRNLAKKISRLR